MLAMTAAAGGPARVPVTGEWGTPERVEAFRWRRGNQTFVALLKSPDVPAGGETLTLSLAGNEAVYDLRRGRRLRGDSVDVHLDGGDWALFGFLPTAPGRLTVRRRGRDELGRPRLRVALSGARRIQGGHVWGIRVTRPGGDTYRAASETLCSESPTLDYTVPLGLDPEPGRWRIRVIHAATGSKAEEDIWVAPRRHP
jgi:hypothetical protein